MTAFAQDTQSPTSLQAWTRVCTRDDLTAYWGEAALVEDAQVALFLVPGASGDRVYAVSNIDPATGSAVMSRGIVGSRQGRVTIASPLHKDVYDLATGECYTNANLSLPVWSVREDGPVLSVALPGTAAHAAA